MSLRRVRSKIGDSFLIPLESSLERYTNDGYGEYLAEPNELFILSQFVFGETKQVPLYNSAGWGRTMMCFGEPLEFSKFNQELAMQLLLQAKPKMEFKVIKEPMRKSWWPKICEAEVSRFTPHQSYAYKSNSVIDYHARVAEERSDLSFREIARISNSSMAETLCAHIFGVRDAGYPDFNYDEYLVTEERAVWNVFPDRYAMDPIQGLLFDGIPVDSVQHM